MCSRNSAFGMPDKGNQLTQGASAGVSLNQVFSWAVTYHKDPKPQILNPTPKTLNLDSFLG